MTGFSGKQDSVQVDWWPNFRKK